MCPSNEWILMFACPFLPKHRLTRPRPLNEFARASYLARAGCGLEGEIRNGPSRWRTRGKFVFLRETEGARMRAYVGEGEDFEEEFLWKSSWGRQKGGGWRGK